MNREGLIKWAIVSILYISALGLIWWGTSWKTALGAFILIWASNLESFWSQERANYLGSLNTKTITDNDRRSNKTQ